MVITCPLLSCCKTSSPFRENNNVVVFPFPLIIFIPFANLWSIRLLGQEVALTSTRSSAHEEGRWQFEEGESLPGINSVLSYVTQLLYQYNYYLQHLYFHFFNKFRFRKRKKDEGNFSWKG